MIYKEYFQSTALHSIVSLTRNFAKFAKKNSKENFKVASFHAWQSSPDLAQVTWADIPEYVGDNDNPYLKIFETEIFGTDIFPQHEFYFRRLENTVIEIGKAV